LEKKRGESGMKVLFLNGASNSGKDTIANIFYRYGKPNIELMKFASPIADALMGMFQIHPSIWNVMYQRNSKDRPNRRLEGMSPREAMIWLSEEIIKPKFGKEFFGRTAAKNILDMDFEQRDNKLFIFSDSGFSYEIKTLIEELKIPQEDVWLATIYREGCSFNGDSRNYVNPDDCGILRDNWYIIENNDTMAMLEQAGLVLYDVILKK